jgi:ribosome biogenesis GTPase
VGRNSSKAPTDHPTGLIVAAHGRRGLIEIAGVELPYVTRGRQLRPICGDRATGEPQARAREFVVTGLAVRDNVLARWHEKNGRVEAVAANVDQLVIVVAPTPVPDLVLVDRYLCAAELMRCAALLVWNKADLAPPPTAQQEYAELGYRQLTVSARDAASLPPLRAALDGGVSALVGQSGVGKSSLLNALVPARGARTGALSAAADSGTHTTTAATMCGVPGTARGRLIDTPGVRGFVPALAQEANIDQGFRELAALAPACRFSDCSHRHEPGCAVRAAVAAGQVRARRYASYLKLREHARPRGQ